MFKFGEVLADAFGEPGVVVPDDDALRRENLEGGFSIGPDALERVAGVDEAEIGVVEFRRRLEGEGVAVELVDARGGGVIVEGKADRGAREPDPLLVAFAEGFDLAWGVLRRQIEGVDVGLRGIERHGESADSAEGSGLKDLSGAAGAGDGREQGVGHDEAQAGEADGVDGREDDLRGIVAAEKGRQGGVIEDGKRVAGVKGVLANAAAKLDGIAARFPAGGAHGYQFHEVADHGEEVP